MKFEEVLTAFRSGKKITRKTQTPVLSHDYNYNSVGYIAIRDLLADDWEIIKEPVKRWKWAVKMKQDGPYEEMSGFYTEEQVKGLLAVYTFGHKKLEYTETEFDE